MGIDERKDEVAFSVTYGELGQLKTLLGQMPYSHSAYVESKVASLDIENWDDLFKWLTGLKAAVEGAVKKHSDTQDELLLIRSQIAGGREFLKLLIDPQGES